MTKIPRCPKTKLQQNSQPVASLDQYLFIYFRYTDLRFVSLAIHVS